MTVTRWTAPDASLIAIQEGRSNIEEIYQKFRDAEPTSVYPASRHIQNIVDVLRLRPEHEQQIFSELVTLCCA